MNAQPIQLHTTKRQNAADGDLLDYQPDQRPEITNERVIEGATA